MQKISATQHFLMLSILQIIVITTVAVGAYTYGRASSVSEIPVTPIDTMPVACTMEAKICPDGSAVGRSGPKCEFAPCPTSPVPPSLLPKRLFDATKKWLNDKPYPRELSALKDSQLIGMSCSKQYMENGDGGGAYSAYDTNGNPETLTDPELINQVKIVSQATQARFDGFISCKTDDNKNIFVFVRMAGGGGMGNTAYFGTITGDSFQSIGSIPNPGIAYFDCKKPLALTSDRMLYVECGGGDGMGGGATIYKIDISNKQIKPLITCTVSGMDTTCTE